jgi:hypothetical protein
VPVRMARVVRSCSAGRVFRARSVVSRMLRQAARPPYPADGVRTSYRVIERMPGPSDFQLAASLWESPVCGPGCDLADGP